MEDNNVNNRALEATEEATPLDEHKAIPLEGSTEELPTGDAPDGAEPSEDATIEVDGATAASLKGWYRFYRSKGAPTEAVSCVNAKTVTGFVLLMLVCVATFIGCIAIDIDSYRASDGSLTTADGDRTDATDSESESDSEPDSEVEVLPINPTVDVPQEDAPERSESTYVNADGTYTVAGVAKYASDSIIAVYVSTDGVTLDGMGSGIVFSDEGYVLTNAHVIEDANYIIGILPDETEVNLSFVGMDTDLDVAVLQSDDPDIPVATLGNSDDVILGEDVVAIGNPAGLTGTVTKGIVSSIDRAYTTNDDVQRNYIQTDTAISPGNSGGALLNMYGQVIGITTLKISEDETYEGLGFAICINDAVECAERLIQNRFRIGITFNLQNDEIEIASIDGSCDVANTDLREGDVVTEIDGYSVHDYSSVMSALEGSEPGDSVTAKVERRSDDGLRSEFYIEFKLMPYGS
jgi:serine protease Do